MIEPARHHSLARTAWQLLPTVVITCALAVTGCSKESPNDSDTSTPPDNASPTAKADAPTTGDSADPAQGETLSPAEHAAAAKALLEKQFSDPTAAMQALARAGEHYAAAHEAAPDDQAVGEALRDVYVETGNIAGLYRLADAALKHDSTDKAARRHRATAIVGQMQTARLSDALRTQARSDLTMLLEANPDDAVAADLHAQLLLYTARDLTQAGHGDQAKRVAQQAVTQAVRFYEGHSNDADVQFRHARILAAAAQPDALEAVLSKLEASVRANPTDADQLMRIVDLLTSVSAVPTGADAGRFLRARADRALALVEQGVAAHPHRPRLHFGRARLAQLLGNADTARSAYHEAATANFSTTPIDWLRELPARRSAYLVLIEDALHAAITAQDDARQARWDQVVALVDQMRTRTGDSGQLAYVEGKMLLARGEWAKAQQRLDQAITALGAANPDALLLSARASARMNEPGAAVTRYERYLQLQPDSLPARREVAQLYLQSQQTERAKVHIEHAAQLAPADPDTRRIQAMLFAQQGEIDAAIAIFEQLDPVANPQLVQPLVSLYVAAGRAGDARAIAERAYDANADNAQLLVQVIRLAGDKEEALTWLDTAREHNISPALIGTLQAQLTGKPAASGAQGDDQSLAERLVNQQTTPLAKALARFAIARRTGDTTAAQDALDDARELAPDQPQVIEAAFTFALERKQYDLADSLAKRAAQMDLDLAGGAFFRARLATAKGDHAAAVKHLKQGLAIRSVFSDGWLMLGGALSRTGEHKQATKAFAAALSQRPASAAALLGIAASLDAQDKHGEALQVLRQAVASPTLGRHDVIVDQYLAYETKYGDADRALELRMKRARNSPAGDSDLTSVALGLARSGDTAQADRLMKEVLDREQVTIHDVASAAAIKRLAGDVDAGAKLIRQYIADRGDAATDLDYILLASYYADAGRDRDVLDAFGEAIRREDPATRRASRRLADLFYSRQNYDAAALYYRQVYDALPNEHAVGMRLTEALARAGKLDDARTTLESLTGKFDDKLTLAMLEALIARQAGEADAALAALDRAEQIKPDYAQIYFERGTILVDQPGRDDDALSALDKAVELQPRLVPAYHLRAVIDLRNGRPDAAIANLKRVLELAPDHQTARLQLAQVYFDTDNRDALVALADESIARYPTQAVWHHLLGQLARKDKRYADAAEAFGKAYELSQAPAHLLTWAAALIDADRPGDAADELTRRSSIVKRSPELMAVRAHAIALAGRSGHTAAFDQAIAMSGNMSQMYHVANQMSRTYDAARSARRLLAADLSGAARTWAVLAAAQQYFAADNHKAVLDTLARTAANNLPGDAEQLQYHRLTALSSEALGKKSEAAAAYRKWLEYDPNNVAALNNLAFLLTDELDQPAEALPLIERAVALVPDSAELADTHGWTLHKVGKHEEAVAVLEKSNKDKPSAATAFHLAEAYFALKQYDNARPYYLQALRTANPSRHRDMVRLVNARILEMGS